MIPHAEEMDRAQKDSTCPMKAVTSIVQECAVANRRDIEWMARRLKDIRGGTTKVGGDRLLVQRIREKILQDREIVRTAKETCEEHQYGLFLNMSRLTKEAPFWGHYESSLELLDCYESLPFQLFSADLKFDNTVEYPLSHIGPCFEKACKSRLYNVYKHVLFYALHVVTFAETATEEKKEGILLEENIVNEVLNHTQFMYPMLVLAEIKELTACCLFDDTSSVFLFPNAGYIFTGTLQEGTPLIAG